MHACNRKNLKVQTRLISEGTIMDTVYIKWVEGVMPFNKIKDFIRKELDKKGFYALLGGTRAQNSTGWINLKLLYVGQAFDQTLRERIPQEHPAYECVFKYQKEHSGIAIVVMIGTIEKSPVAKLTQQLFNDIECCLIFCNQPLCNTTCKESYSGRDLQVINTEDYKPLKEKCACSET